MITGNISNLTKTSNMYKARDKKVDKITADMDFQDAMEDAKKSMDMGNPNDNYSKNQLFRQTKEAMAKKLSVLGFFEEVKSEYPNCKQWNAYLDKVDGSGKLKLGVCVTHCRKDTQIGPKELAEALNKVISVVNKMEHCYREMDYRLDNAVVARLEYHKDTGKIDIKEMALGFNDLVKTIADNIYKEFAKDKDIPIEELARLRANFERIKREMDDFIIKTCRDERTHV